MKNTLKGLRTMKNMFCFILISSMLFLTSCDIPADLNDNPNEITLDDVDARLFLNGAQLANIMIQNSHLNRISGMFSGQLVGYTSLYSNIYGYSLSTVESNDEWNGCYIGILTNTRYVRDVASDDNLLVGMAKVIEAHAIGTLAILMGDVPFSEVQNNAVDDPQFDSQISVLQAVTSLLDDAILDLGSATSRPESYDLYYNGDKDKWIAAAYTLKARYALVQNDYAGALTAANSGISSSADDMNFIPRGDAAVSEGDKNLFNAILAGSRAGDIGNNGSYLLELLNDSTANYRGNDKTDETNRHNYYKIDENSGEGNLGVIERFEPMPMVTYFENKLILAEAAARTSFADGLAHLNDYRAWLTSGGRVNATFLDSADILYDAYVEADFQSDGMENADGATQEDALLREIIEERYVSGFGTYMPFNDHRRLRARGETDLIPPFPLNTTAATVHVERIPWAQDELTTNSNAPEDPGLYVATEVNGGE